MLYHILAIGDVVGGCGVSHLERHLRAVKKLKNIHFTVVNGENAAMVGLTPNDAEDIFAAGADVITLGNHTFGKMQIRDYLDAITLSSQSTPECINCPVGVGCGWCSAYNYESTGDVNRRVTNICWAHKGRTLASCYYHNKRYLELRDTTPKAVLLPEKDALQIIPREEYEYLLRLQAEAEKVFLKEGGEDGI